MAERRRRHLRRNTLVLLGSLCFHVALFFIAASDFNFYTLPPENQPAVQVEIVPENVEPIPPPPVPPIVKPKTTPTPQPATPPPTPQPQPQPQPQPPTPARAPQQPAQAQTAPVQARQAPTPAPSPKPTPAPAPLTPPAPAPTPGPPRSISRSQLQAPQTRAVAAPHIVLHRNRDQGEALAPPVTIPGATFAPPPQAGGAAPGGGAPAGGPGGGAGRLLGGALPGFGGGLRGGPLGCANAAALHLSRAEQDRCDEAFGAGARESPRMDAIGATKRAEFEHEAATEAAAQKYRDSTPAGSDVRPEAGQPRAGHSPSQ
jgi:hypothetical protein